MREPTVVASSPKALVEFAVSRGADRETLLRRAGIHAHDLLDQNGRIPIVRYVALMKTAIELCNEPALALLYGEHVMIEDLSIVPLIVVNAENAKDRRAKMNRYAPLMMDDGEDGNADRPELVQRGGKTWVRLASAQYARHPVLTESAIARSVCGVRKMMSALGGPVAMLRFPEAIHFTYPEPAHRKEYDRLFGVPLEFGSDMNAIAIDPMLLTLPMPKTHGAAAALVTEQAEHLLAQLENSRSTRASVEGALLRSLERSDVRMEAIARQLGLSRATLFRRLKAEGATFEEVLESLRQRRALQLLNEEKCSVRQTARLLGFSDSTSFSRAFKRWTGVSPKHVNPRANK